MTLRPAQGELDALPEFPAPYLNGPDSPADGQNVIRCLLSRAYSDGGIKRQRQRLVLLPASDDIGNG